MINWVVISDLKKLSIDWLEDYFDVLRIDHKWKYRAFDWGSVAREQQRGR